MTNDAIGYRTRTVSNIRCPACDVDRQQSFLAIENEVLKGRGVRTTAICTSPRCSKVFQSTAPDTPQEKQGKKNWKSRRDRAIYIFAGSIVATYLISITAYAATK